MKTTIFLNKYKFLYWFFPLSGIFISLTHPSIISNSGLWGVEYIGVFLLLLCMLAPSYAKSVLLVFLSGLLYFASALHWVALFGILPYIAVIILFSAVFFLLPSLATRPIKNEILRLISFILLFTAIEWLRGLSIYGFPGGEIGGGNIC